MNHLQAVNFPKFLQILMNVIEIEQLNKYFGEGENRAHILKDINVNIQQGDFVAIIGASGSGKSTLMNIIGCLIRQVLAFAVLRAKKPSR